MAGSERIRYGGLVSSAHGPGPRREPTAVGSDALASVAADASLLFQTVVFVWSDEPDEGEDELDFDITDVLMVGTELDLGRGAGDPSVDIGSLLSLLQMLCSAVLDDDGIETFVGYFVLTVVGGLDSNAPVFESPLAQSAAADGVSLLLSTILAVAARMPYVWLGAVALVRPSASWMVMGSAASELCDLLSDRAGDTCVFSALSLYVMLLVAGAVALLKSLTGAIHAYILCFFAAVVVDAIA